MIGGFFVGSTVDAVKKAKKQADAAMQSFRIQRARAIADRESAIRIASDEIAALAALDATTPVSD